MSSTGLYVLASATSPIPLSYLDYNFNYINESVSLVSSTVAAISTTVNALSATVGSIYNSLSNVSITVFLQGQPSSSSSSNVWSIIGSNTFVPSQTVSVSNEASFSSALSTTKLTLLSFTSPVSITGIYSLSPNIGLAFSGSGALLSNGYIEFNNNYINASPTAAIFQPYGYGGTLNYVYPEWFGSSASANSFWYVPMSLAPVLVCNGSYSNVTILSSFSGYLSSTLIGSGTFTYLSVQPSTSVIDAYIEGLTIQSASSLSLQGSIQNTSFISCTNIWVNGLVNRASFTSCTNIQITPLLQNSSFISCTSMVMSGTINSCIFQNCLSPVYSQMNYYFNVFINNQFLGSQTFALTTNNVPTILIGNLFLNNNGGPTNPQFSISNGNINVIYNNIGAATGVIGQVLAGGLYAANNSGTLLVSSSVTIYGLINQAT